VIDFIETHSSSNFISRLKMLQFVSNNAFFRKLQCDVGCERALAEGIQQIRAGQATSPKTAHGCLTLSP
jgi:hypothetical protein